MTLTKYVDEKLLITLLLFTVLAFFLKKYLTKKIIHPQTGEVSHYAGAGKSWI